MKHSILIGFIWMTCFSALLLISFNAEATPHAGGVAYFKTVQIKFLIGAPYDISSNSVSPGQLINQLTVDQETSEINQETFSQTL